ncbi:hypothetical protein ACFOUV_00770 [Oceanobacillus longus]|uniref:Antigen I/II N-terminal domain-containing protein n=1 Tax=Oceanobacillus longus TaxID=930120 RepID=A0ABV8GUV3_9BACI
MIVNRKKSLCLIVLLSLLLLLAACGDNDTGNTENQESGSASEKESDESLDVDKGLLNVEVTLPPNFFESEEKDVATIIEEAEAEEGIKEVTQNSDGTLTYKMSKSKHKEMMEEMESEISTTIEDMVTSEDYVSIQDVKASKSFSEFTMVVDREGYENSFDGFAALTLGMSGMLYQLFDGASPDDYNVTISLEDAATGEVFDTVNYPEALEEAEEATE